MVPPQTRRRSPEIVQAVYILLSAEGPCVHAPVAVLRTKTSLLGMLLTRPPNITILDPSSPSLFKKMRGGVRRGEVLNPPFFCRRTVHGVERKTLLIAMQWSLLVDGGFPVVFYNKEKKEKLESHAY
jgi:hypothetical protein